MPSVSPVLDLAGVTLEVHHLARAVRYYAQVFGLAVEHVDEASGVARLRVNDRQTLTLWMPITRVRNDARLAALGARGAAHLHFAWQVEAHDLDACREVLGAHDVRYEVIDLGTPDAPDVGLYFHDPFGHGLELRGVNLADGRRPAFPPARTERAPYALPVIGLREAALAFWDYAAMKARLPRAYGFAFAKEQDDRNFAQFTLAPGAREDGNGTPQRWLYAWDPQVGLADMPGGDHATVAFWADVDAVEALVRAEGLPCLRDARGLAVRDPDGHVFEFLQP